MIAYVGLDLGVDTSVVTNSVAPKLYLRKPFEQKEDQGHDMELESVIRLSAVLDIQPDGDQTQIV
jgi:methylglyoxal synthase